MTLATRPERQDFWDGIRLLGRAPSYAFSATVLLAATLGIGLTWALTGLLHLLVGRALHIWPASPSAWHPASSAGEWLMNIAGDLLEPFLAVLQLVQFVLSPQLTLSTRFCIGLVGVCNLAVWLGVGAIIARAVAVQVAEVKWGSLPRTVTEALRRVPRCWGGVALPLGAILGLWGLIFALGLPAIVPGLDQWWVTLLSPIGLIIGLAAAFLCLMIVVCWPWMAVSAAVEDADSFGVLSRCCSFLLSRPWLAMGLLVVVVVEGAILLLLLHWLLMWGQQLVLGAWVPTLRAEALQDAQNSLRAVAMFVYRAVATGLFWTLITLLYLIIRREVDGIPFETISGAERETPVKDPYPVVGIPATDAVIPMTVPAPANSTDEHS